jgi:two-component system chemotaxis sensor kinase CheA
MADESGSDGGVFSEDMAEFLGIYIDETGEQCEQLVQALLALEANPRDAGRLAESFRLIHTIKGAAALLGLDKITSLAHHLESHFERLRSGSLLLDGPMIEVTLRSVDYLRACNARLRKGEPPEPANELLETVKRMGQASAPVAVPDEVVAPAPRAQPAGETRLETLVAAPATRTRRIRVHFAAGLAMVDIKAELVVSRLGALGTVVEVTPAPGDLAARPDPVALEIVLRTDADGRTISSAADVDGVERVEIDVEPPVERPAPTAPVEGAATFETMRVGVDRLDVLLNLAGELIVSRARFVQLVSDMAPIFKKAAVGGRSGNVVLSLREAVESIVRSPTSPVERAAAACAAHLDKIEDQARLWDEGHKRYAELVESVDHLTRVADNLQRGVLGTRMVPIGPLFNRYKRSVRDIAGELGKSVMLEVTGEKTELDKRMIDELGDPLVHLVRNAIDHGIEPADVRLRKGKPETATVRLAAAHRGNSVIISISDDGGGIDVERIRERAISRGLVSAEQAATLSPRELTNFIWQPGFSTAREVSNISGRGVGMDIVRTRIESLSGSIDIDSTPDVGTTFNIRLPLTLAIARCMLFRMEQAAFAVPVENVREIVTVSNDQTLVVGGRRVCDIRGEFLPLVDMDRIFSWTTPPTAPAPSGAVLVLQAGTRAVAASVGSLLGTQDLVVKSLDDNFMRIRGLGGVSILGDGEVCLLLDVAAVIDTIMRPRAAAEVPAS